MSRVLVVVQQRLGSTRLPGKAKADIAGVSATEHVIRRGLATGRPLVLAVPGSDDFSWLKVGHPRCYLFQDHEGEESDLIGRFVRAVAAYVPVPEIIVRLTGDCPFVPVGGIVAAVDAIRHSGVQYAETRSDPSSRPNGIDAQAFTYDVLMRANDSKEHREHVTGALVEAAGHVGLVSHIDDIDLNELPPIRITLDTADDLARYREMCRHLRVNPRFGYPDLGHIMDLYGTRPDLFYLDEG